MPSVEEKVEEYFKKILDANKVRHYGKTEKMNPAIASALKNADSKSGGSGCNFPDIQMMLENSNARRIPVMVEAKGTKNKLEKRDKSGAIVGVTYYDKDGRPGKDGKPVHLKGEPNYSAVKDYAVNGAVHYGNAVLDEGTYNEAIVVGVNGTALDDAGGVADAECKSYSFGHFLRSHSLSSCLLCSILHSYAYPQIYLFYNITDNICESQI